MRKEKVFPIGSETVIDSCFSLGEALRDNPVLPCPEDIRQRQRIVTVWYWSFDRRIHRGQIVVDCDIVVDIREAFKLLFAEEFPVARVIPIARYAFDDEHSMRDNNTSAFNYRKKDGKDEFSLHAFGRAIDINPWLNPFIRETSVVPVGARYDPAMPGTLTQESRIVRFFKSRGYVWGGDWTACKDYQHFEKPFCKG